MLSTFIETLKTYRWLFRISLGYFLICLLIAYLVKANDAQLTNFRVYTNAFIEKYITFSIWALFLGSVYIFFNYIYSKISVKKIPDKNELIRIYDQFLEVFVLKGLPSSFAIVICLFGMATFFIGKSMVITFGGFFADPFFVKLEHVLHFGFNPAMIFPDFLYNYDFVYFMDNFYLSWFAFMFAFMSFALFFEKNIKKQQLYFLTYALIWMGLGTVLAIALSSCGPIFLEYYHPDLAYLYKEPLQKFADLEQSSGHSFFFMTTSDELVMLAKASGAIQFYSISAMPSIHVAIAWLNFLYARSVNKYFGYITLVYALIILFGSVFLLWHYAIDGYVSIITVSLIWHFMGKLPAFQKPEEEKPA